MTKDKENIMLTGGITNPLDVIEQFTYLCKLASIGRKVGEVNRY